MKGQRWGVKGNLLGAKKMRTWECGVAKREGPKPVSREPEARDSRMEQTGAPRPREKRWALGPFGGARASCAPQKGLWKPRAPDACDCDPLWEEGLCRRG